MNHKKLLTPASVTALLTIVLAVVFSQFWGISLQSLMEKIFILAIYGFLITLYLLRIAFVFLGVFAVYQVASEHVNNQELKQMKV